MLIQRINRTDPERVFLVVRNDQGASVGKGRPLSFKMDGTRDGIDAEYDDAVGNQALICGLAHTDIGDGDYGLVQAYGYDDDAIVVKTNSHFLVGAVLGVLSASTCLQVISTSHADKMVYAPIAAGAESIASAAAATTTAKVFLRML